MWSHCVPDNITYHFSCKHTHTDLIGVGRTAKCAHISYGIHAFRRTTVKHGSTLSSRLHEHLQEMGLQKIHRNTETTIQLKLTAFFLSLSQLLYNSSCVRCCRWSKDNFSLKINLAMFFSAAVDSVDCGKLKKKIFSAAFQMKCFPWLPIFQRRPSLTHNAISVSVFLVLPFGVRFG